MSGTPSALPPLVSGAFGGVGNPISPSVVNSYRINAVAERLLSHVQPGNRSDPNEFYQLCLSLSRGIDYALANNEIPDKAQDLPRLVKQVCQRKNDELSQAAVMVLMISVKNACKLGWYKTKESEELFTIAEEMGKTYCSMGNVNAGPSSCHPTIPTIMERFYPRMKLGTILASIEAKPGYGASTVDFYITKTTVEKDKICLLVAQTDNIETSACLISPQQVNFILNGKGVDRRTNVLMDTGPQMPTNVTGMLKYGTNLLQAVGQFSSHYVILVAYVSVASLPEHPVLLDYVQPAVTSVDSDSDIIEGPSQISLNCPISFKRIKTPVKGHSCKHFQCFDFDNFININSRRPSWRCPHCNQCVSYTDIRLDQNMVEVLKDVGENILEVILHADGSWKAVLENDHNVDKMQNKARNCEKEQTVPQVSTWSPSAVPNVLDLTNDEDQMEIMDTFETADRKPFQASVHGQFVTSNSTSLGMNSAGLNQNVAAQIEDDFWSGLYIARGRSDTLAVGVSEQPVLPDSVSPAFNQEAEGHDNNPAANSSVHNQFSAPNNLQLQLSYNSVVNEYGRSSSMPRHINRTPVAVQALPVQSQALGPQQNPRTNLNSLLPSSSTATSRVSLSSPTTTDGFNAILSDTERQQHFSRSPMNLPQVSGVNSSALHHNSATQNRVPPANMSAPSQLQNPYRASGLLTELTNAHLQQALNPRTLQPTQLSNTQRSHFQQGGSQAGIVQAAGATANSQHAMVMAAAQVARQGSSQAGIVQAAGATANSQQARVMAGAQVARQTPSIPVQNQTSVAATSFTSDSFRGLTGEQRGNVGGTPQSVSRPDDLFNLQSEQNWRPIARMRGSLAGRQYSDSVRQRIIAPTQPVQSSNSQGPQPVRPTQPVQSSRPQGPQAIQPTQPVQSSRPQGPQAIPQAIQPTQPTQPVQSSRPQGPQRPSGMMDVLIANSRNAHNHSSNK